MSNDGSTFHKLGSFSAPFGLPFIFGNARSCKSETVRPDPVASSNVLPFGLAPPLAVLSETAITEVMRRKRSKTSSLLSCVPRGRGICDERWSRKYSKVLEICSSTGSHPGIGVECRPSLPRLITPETRLSQSTNEMISYCALGSLMLLSRNCSIDRRQVMRNESWKPDAQGVLSRSGKSSAAAIL